MIINLVKKDFLLVKKYLAVTCLVAFAFPVLVNNISLGSLVFAITTLIILYVLFNSVSIIEEKSKGPALLCATPYTRDALVKAKYLFNITVFVFCCVLYICAAAVFPSRVAPLSLSTVGTSMLFIAVIFGVMIPFQYKFGYEKAKYISTVFIFLTPFVLPGIAVFLRDRNINLNFQLPVPNIIQVILPYLLTIVLGTISMLVSIHIYSKKEL